MDEMLTIGGVRADKLVKALGTPLMVYDEGALEKRLCEFKESFVHPAFETQVIYASKAFSCTAMLELVKSAGCGLDVVSGGELAAAEHADFPMSEIVFHGNNKTPYEIRSAISCGVGSIIIDGKMELDEVIKAACELKKKTSVIVRVNPGIEADTHKYIITANIDSKFGVSIYERGCIFDMIRKISECKYLEFQGIHIHIGSQIFGIDPFITGIRRIMEFIADVEKAGYPVKTLDLGGGFAATYIESDIPLPISLVCNHILLECKNQKDIFGVSVEKIMIEPGRSMVAEAGLTLYTVGYSKQTANKKYVFVDGGMSDNIRPALYGAKYRCDAANKMNAPRTEKVCVAGKCCESGDILIEETTLPPLEPGDLLALYTTGAYGYSMASNYNRLPLPAVAFVKDGRARCVLKRQPYEDMWRLDDNSNIEL